MLQEVQMESFSTQSQESNTNIWIQIKLKMQIYTLWSF